MFFLCVESATEGNYLVKLFGGRWWYLEELHKQIIWVFMITENIKVMYSIYWLHIHIIYEGTIN